MFFYCLFYLKSIVKKAISNRNVNNLQEINEKKKHTNISNPIFKVCLLLVFLGHGKPNCHKSFIEEQQQQQ